MFKKLNIKVLIIALVALGGILFAVEYSDSNKSMSSFKKKLVQIDTANVTALYVYPKGQNHKEIKIYKEGASWFVEMEGKKKANASTETLQGSLMQLSAIKTKRVAGTKKTQWEKFEVTDSLGTRIKVMEGKNIALDMYLGKFSFQQQTRSASSFVRVANDDNTYSVDGFLDINFNRDMNAWRDQGIVKSDHDSWTKLVFKYPADSSFVIEKRDDETWGIDMETPDSIELVKYFRSISNLQNSDFIDDYDVSSLSNPTLSLVIQGVAIPDITINAFQADTTNKYIVTSSMNPGTYFTCAKTNLAEKIFVRKDKFFPPPEEEEDE